MSALLERDSLDASPPPVTGPPLTRWDHLLPAAYQAGERAALAAQEAVVAARAESTPYFLVTARPPEEMYREAFGNVIFDALPDLDIETERGLVYVDVDIAWKLRDAANKPVHVVVNDFCQLLAIDLANGPMGHGRFIHRLRRLSQHRTTWNAILTQIKEWMEHPQYATYSGIAEYTRGLRAEATAIFRAMQEVNRPALERAYFDASQVERHMDMAHRVPADVSNLVGQFATAGITAYTPIPVRYKTKHRLELLARRVASLTPEQVAAEMRSILAEVETVLPEDARK